jgi:tetratricopeptide (TPR) repeat protein
MPRFRWKKLISPKARTISRADAARDNNEPAVAAKYYRDAIRRWGSSYALLMQFGNALKDSGSFNDAEQAYRDALAIRNTEADTFLQYGHLMKVSGKLEKAEEFYRKALELDPLLAAARHEIDIVMAGRAPTEVEQHRLSIRNDMPLPASIVYYRLLNNHRWRRG